MVPPSEPEGSLFLEDGLEWYRIENYDLLDPFLVNVIAPHNQWLFVSSTGAVTAGRHSAEHAIFAYETEDRLHRNGGRSGPITLIRIEGTNEIWEPFALHVPFGQVKRSMAKTAASDRLRFEEHNPKLGLTFRYTWSMAGEYGLVRSCELVRDEGLPAIEVRLLDGLLDLLPAGVEYSTQLTTSTLIDAYRRSEFDPESRLALFTLEAMVSDRPDPAESLKATVAWSVGLPDAVTALSDRQIRGYRSGHDFDAEHLVTGMKGAFLVSTRTRLEEASPLVWTVVADVGHDHLEVARLRKWLAASPSPEIDVQEAVDAAHGELVRLVAQADAGQETGDRRLAVSHFANVLYNCLRGGVPVGEHRVAVADVGRFVAKRNRLVHSRFGAIAETLEPVVELDAIREAVRHDVDLARLVAEYLPLTFSRRHGDPSRPWNSFKIGVESEGGDIHLSYEGNWRDIFQNWEALVYSFPHYAESVVAKFLNASTQDGHNPYRITSEGIEWEMPEEGSWSNFGYWGDHQIVYLHRLLDAMHRHHPGVLEGMLHHRAFSYANVPYRILPYERIVRDPKHTLEFDHAEQTRIDERVMAIGLDGKLIAGEDGQVHHASLAEKLLVPALAKLSNLTPDGGIWLNTQRPEWNDANNALVGIGVSVVTAFHLREYLSFVDGLLERSLVTQVPMAQPVIDWIRGLESAYASHGNLLSEDRNTPEGRRRLLDQTGAAYSEYRYRVYSQIPGRDATVPVSDLRQFVGVAQEHVDAVVESARRPDGLVDAYRLLRLDSDRAELEPLFVMLEGQVAALGSSKMDLDSACQLIDAMFESDLYRDDQGSFLLYPNEPRLPFMEKNRVPESQVGPALSRLIDADHGIARRDAGGIVRFNSDFRSARDLVSALDALDASSRLDSAERSEVLDAYEAVFNHRAFTGRSQTMYRYEGLGSIYWHMVAKLLVAMQERLFASIDSHEDGAHVDQMINRYRRVRAGLGNLKPVAVHGAFPLDPHSHTPAHTGAQQPGMTGAVKEGILLRWGELGVRVEEGTVSFQPYLLDDEFLEAAAPWEVLGPGKTLEAGTMGFTYCGVPVVYHRHSGEPWTRVEWTSGHRARGGARLDREASAALFARSGAIKRIDVGVQPRTNRPR